ncbi:MAG TPA: PilZ domain-containing protein [Gemmatimonadales bacterium]|nr:PilZ domain-containing protein [Gemmatimonadales bacterium]
MTPSDRWRASQLDRRTLERIEYRRTAPGLLVIDGCRCAVRDLGPGGLRIEPAPAGRVWQHDQEISGTLMLRTGEPIAVRARIGRIDRAGLALFPEGDEWPSRAVIERERTTLMQHPRERRGAPRLPIPSRAPGAPGPATPLRDVSATGLRYVLTASESAPANGSRIEGMLQVDAETVIEVCGRVVRHEGREIAVAFDPPGLDPTVLAVLRQRFFQPAGARRHGR